MHFLTVRGRLCPLLCCLVIPLLPHQDLDRATTIVRDYILSVVEQGVLNGNDEARGGCLDLENDPRFAGLGASGMIRTMCR